MNETFSWSGTFITPKNAPGWALEQIENGIGIQCGRESGIPWTIVTRI